MKASGEKLATLETMEKEELYDGEMEAPKIIAALVPAAGESQKIQILKIPRRRRPDWSP